MPERFEIYIVYKRRYINTLPFLFPFTVIEYNTIRYIYVCENLSYEHHFVLRLYMTEQSEEIKILNWFRENTKSSVLPGYTQAGQLSLSSLRDR